MAASKKTPKPSQVGLSHPHQYIYSCMANRFAIERDDGFVLVHFGLLNRKKELIGRISFNFSDFTLTALRENLVTYSGKIGLPKKETLKWDPPEYKVPGEDPAWEYLPVVDFIHLSNWNDSDAEMCFWSYSQAQMSDLAQAGGTNPPPMIPWGIALLRCPIDLQRDFLSKLYPAK